MSTETNPVQPAAAADAPVPAEGEQVQIGPAIKACIEEGFEIVASKQDVVGTYRLDRVAFANRQAAQATHPLCV